MDDPEVVAAIAAGELDGLAAALDEYAASLYEYCYSMAPEVAADAVQDTFIIAWSKLGGLRDPGKLHPWLQAVAGNECFRRTLAGSMTDAHADVAPETTLPPGLPGQILSACADNTPAGRAQRTSVTHRAGPFGYDGFPKANALGGTWRRRFRRHRQAGAAVAAAAVLAAAAIMIVAISPAGSSHHHQASAASPAGSRPAGRWCPARTSRRREPGRSRRRAWRRHRAWRRLRRRRRPGRQRACLQGRHWWSRRRRCCRKPRRHHRHRRHHHHRP